jgi:hypothetical protein
VPRWPRNSASSTSRQRAFRSQARSRPSNSARKHW